MKVKIIKRRDREETQAKVLAAESKPKEATAYRGAALVNSWVEELRQKRATDAELSREFFALGDNAL